MGSNNRFLFTVFSVLTVLLLAQDLAVADRRSNHETDPTESSQKKRRTASPKKQDLTGCVSSVVKASLKSLFKSEKDLVQVQKLAAEIARRMPIDVESDVKNLLSIAKKSKVSTVDLVAALIQPESGLDENQVHKLIAIATEDLKGKGNSNQTKNLGELERLLMLVVEDSGHGMTAAVKNALAVGGTSEPGFTPSKLHVLLHSPEFKPLNPKAMETALREVTDIGAEASLIEELNADSSLKNLTPEDRIALAKLLRAYQKLEFAGDADRGHEMAEELASFALEHGVTGALPALISKNNARYCILAGGDPQKLAEVDKELAEMVEGISDKYGYKHIEAEKLAPALRDMGRYGASSEEFIKAAQSLIAEMITGDKKMNLADVMFLVDQAHLVPDKTKMKAFAMIAQSSLVSAGSAGIKYGKLDISAKQALDLEMSEIRSEKSPAKVKELTTNLLQKVKELRLDEENVLAHLTSDAFLVGANPKLAENAGTLVPKRQAINQAHALMEAGEKTSGQEALDAIDQIAKLDILGGLGGVDDGGDPTAPQKSGTWRNLADRVLAKAKTDSDVRDALEKMYAEDYWMGPRAEHIKSGLGKLGKTTKAKKNTVDEIEAEGTTTMRADQKKPDTDGENNTANKKTKTAGKPTVGGGLARAATSLVTGDKIGVAVGLATAITARKRAATAANGTNGTDKKTELADRRTDGETGVQDSTTAMTAEETSKAEKAIGKCIACHKAQSGPEFDPANKDGVLALLNASASEDNSAADILADMSERAERNGQTAAESRALAKYLGIKVTKAQNTPTPKIGNGEIATNKVPTSLTGGSDTQQTPNPTYPTGTVTPGPKAGYRFADGRMLSTPAAQDKTNGVVNFVLGDDGLPLVVSADPKTQGPLHVPPQPGSDFPPFALVKRDGKYFFTGRDGKIPTGANPIGLGESIPGYPFGLPQGTNVAMAYDEKAPDKVRFVPAGPLVNGSAGEMAARQRQQQTSRLAIPQVDPPAPFVARKNALEAAGYQPTSFNELISPNQAVVMAKPKSGGAPQALVIDATRAVQGTNRAQITPANTGFAFVGKQAAKLLSAPSRAAIAAAGLNELTNADSRGGLHVDVMDKSGKNPERLWVAKDPSGTYLIHVPLSKDAEGKIVGPVPGGTTRIEKLLDGQVDEGGLASFARKPIKPFASDAAKRDPANVLNTQLASYANESAATAMPVTPIQQTQTSVAQAQPITRVQPQFQGQTQPQQRLFFNRRDRRGGRLR